MKGRKGKRDGWLALPVAEVVAIVAGAAVLTGLVLGLTMNSSGRAPVTEAGATTTHSRGSQPGLVGSGLLRGVAPAKPKGPAPSTQIQSYDIGTETLTLIDPSRTIGSQQRAFKTIVRYPRARNGQAAGPFPLIVFGHGYAVSPQPYSLLLDAWTRAGYVVAAPVFPLENADAPGGPNEKDLVNQPGDMGLTIESLIRGSNGGDAQLAQLIDSGSVAVAGQSDGGDTALAAAYDPNYHFPDIGAAVILSGAEDPFARAFSMPASGPPLLAVQGTADTVNPPDQTFAFYHQAAAPKFLLQLIGASHQPPYTEPGPELSSVERTTIAFLDAVLKNQPSDLERLLAAGTAGDDSKLSGTK